MSWLRWTCAGRLGLAMPAHSGSSQRLDLAFGQLEGIPAAMELVLLTIRLVQLGILPPKCYQDAAQPNLLLATSMTVV